MPHPLPSYRHRTVLLLLAICAYAYGWEWRVKEADSDPLSERDREQSLWPKIERGVFSAAECRNITDIFLDQEEGRSSCMPFILHDESPLAVKHAETVVAATGARREEVTEKARYSACMLSPSHARSGVLDWVYVRVLEALPALGPLSDLRERIQFTLLHEFREGEHFAWHVDTLPGDGSGRSWSVNVMLSESNDFATTDTDYKGGRLQLGDRLVDAHRGDLYTYPASFPHEVSRVTEGRRHTLVIALTEPRPFASTWVDYWSAAQSNLRDLLRSGRPTAALPRIRVIDAQFKEATDLGEEMVESALCMSYAVSDHPARFAEHLARDGDVRCQEELSRPDQDAYGRDIG